MKKQKVEFELKKNGVQKKQLYKKPQLNAVRLFADQVLGSCLASPGSDCGDGPCRATSN